MQEADLLMGSQQQFSDPRNALYLWGRLKGIFGTAFLTSFGEIPDQVWIEALSKLSEKDINAGLNKVLRGGYDFAPSLSKFLKLCTPETVEDVYKQERDTQLMLENRRTITSSSDVRKAEIAKMKQMMGIRS